MVSIYYNIGCRNCLQGDGMQHVYNIMNADSEKYLLKTEFEVMTLIEEWRQEDNHTCEFCGSQNVEVLDAGVDDYPLYDFKRLEARCNQNRDYMLMFNIQKKGADITLTSGGSRSFDPNFLKFAIQQIIKLIEQRPHDNFITQIKGNFFVCLTGRYDDIISQNITRLEKFRCHGLNRNEILNAISNFSINAGIQISIENKIEHILKGNIFKGALFNEWLYAESIEKAEQNGYPYANACFNLDETTLIAHGTGDDESPRDFINNNKFVDFVVDSTKDPIIINGKTVFFAKRVDNNG